MITRSRKRVGRMAAVVVAAAASTIVISTPAQAQTVVTGTVHACVRVKGTSTQKGLVRILNWPGARFVGTAPKACSTSTEVNVYWDFYGGGNGPVGPNGDTGPTGNTGAIGPTGSGYSATSSTTMAVGAGSRTFTTQTSLAYSPGARVRLSDQTDNARFFEGVVVSYNNASGSMTVQSDLRSQS